MAIKWFVGVGALLLLISLGMALPWGDGRDGTHAIHLDPDRQRSGEHLQVTGTPLFFFGNLYLDGRSNWLARQFLLERQQFSTFAVPEGLTFVSKIHREPFTYGSWLDLLGEDLASLRSLTEKEAIESRVSFVVEDVDPQRMVRFLACSDFVERIGGDASRQRERFYAPFTTPPEGLDVLPKLSSHQFLTHDKWSGSLLARPTDVYFVNEVKKFRDIYSLVYEVWKDCGSQKHAPVRMSSGQYVVGKAPEGSLVHLQCYFRGQDIPPGFDGLVYLKTRQYFEELRQVVIEQAPGWQPDAPAREWIDGMRWDGS